MKKILTTLLCTLCLATTVQAKEFSDVSTTSWYHGYVSDMASLGLVEGFSDGTYRPESTLTLAEFSAMVSGGFYGNSMERLSLETFPNWWENAVYSTYLRGGYVGTTMDEEIQSFLSQNYLFEGWSKYVDLPLTRYDMAAMVTNVLIDRYVPSLSQTEINNILAEIPDVSAQSPYATAVATAYHHGLLKGNPLGLFEGEGYLRRCEAAVVLSALVDTVNLESKNDGQAVLQSSAYQMSDYNLTGYLDIENYIFARVNELRTSLGLNTLVSDDILVHYANIRAQEAEIRWAHTRPDGSSWSTVKLDIDKTNTLTSENLTMGSGFQPYEFADMIFKSWLNSPGHYSAMVNPIQEKLGVAVYVNQEGAYYAAQIFAQETK